MTQSKKEQKLTKKQSFFRRTEDRRTYEAVEKILKENIANVILVGSEEAVKKGSEGLDITGAVVVDPAKSDKTQSYIDKLVELRGKKGMTPEKAEEIMLNQYLYYGVMMVKMGDADGNGIRRVPLHSRYLKTLSADSENKTGYKTGFRFLPDVCSGL